MKRGALIALLLVMIGAEAVLLSKRWTDTEVTVSPSPSILSRQSRQVASQTPAVPRNSLRIKDAALTGNPIELAIAPAQDFNGKTRSEILSIRRDAASKYSELIAGKYEPFAPSFESIEDLKPWWGNDGLFFFSAGKKSIVGASERSTIIVNPYLLVDADFDNVPFINVHQLDFVDFFEAKYSDPGFAYFPKMIHLRWFTKDGRAELDYDLTSFLKFIKKHALREFPPQELSFSFRTLNARDWGYDYVYLDIEHSKNVNQAGHKNAAMPTRDFIHTGGSCRYPGGCNNHSPFQAEISHVQVSSVPAAIHFLLWKKEPASTDAPPDFVYDVQFE